MRAVQEETLRCIRSKRYSQRKSAWIRSNCEGRKGKEKLDPVRIEKIQAATFKLWPLEGKEKYKDAWKEYKKAIDEGGGRDN